MKCPESRGEPGKAILNETNQAIIYNVNSFSSLSACYFGRVEIFFEERWLSRPPRKIAIGLHAYG